MVVAKRNIDGHTLETRWNHVLSNVCRTLRSEICSDLCEFMKMLAHLFSDKTVVAAEFLTRSRAWIREFSNFTNLRMI